MDRTHREARVYLEMTYADFEERRDARYERMVAHEQAVDALPAKHRDAAAVPKNLRALLADAHRSHRARAALALHGERSDEQPEGLLVTRADGTVATDDNGNVITLAEEARIHPEDGAGPGDCGQVHEELTTAQAR